MYLWGPIKLHETTSRHNNMGSHHDYEKLVKGRGNSKWARQFTLLAYLLLSKHHLSLS